MLFVKIPLKTLNRHDLLAGATGYWKNQNPSSNCQKIYRGKVFLLLMDLKGRFKWAGQRGPWSCK